MSDNNIGNVLLMLFALESLNQSKTKLDKTNSIEFFRPESHSVKSANFVLT